MDGTQGTTGPLVRLQGREQALCMTGPTSLDVCWWSNVRGKGQGDLWPRGGSLSIVQGEHNASLRDSDMACSNNRGCSSKRTNLPICKASWISHNPVSTHPHAALLLTGALPSSSPMYSRALGPPCAKTWSTELPSSPRSWRAYAPLRVASRIVRAKATEAQRLIGAAMLSGCGSECGLIQVVGPQFKWRERCC
jgi:hypothetical protein